MKNIRILLVLMFLLFLSWSPVSALTIDETPFIDGTERVRFTVTVDEGYELTGFVVGNIHATDAIIDWFGDEGSAVTLIDYTPNSLFTEGQSEYWQTATEYDTNVGFIDSPFNTEEFNDWTIGASISPGLFFSFYHVDIDEGDTPAYFSAGIWDVFIGETQYTGSPIFAVLRNVDTGEMINVSGETGDTIELGSNGAPVPEPTTITLFGLGLLGLLGLARVTKRKL